MINCVCICDIPFKLRKIFEQKGYNSKIVKGSMDWLPLPRNEIQSYFTGNKPREFQRMKEYFLCK